MKNNYRMRIKAVVNCPPSALGRSAEKYHGKACEIIDFAMGERGLVALCLIDNGANYALVPMFTSEILIEKENTKNDD